jgi:hypothetical protein
VVISSGAHWVVVAVVLAGAMMFASLAVVRASARLPVPLAASVALALLVCVETVLLNVLSAFDAVTRAGLVTTHAVTIVSVLAVFRGAAQREVARLLVVAKRRRVGLSLALAPIFLVVLLSALRYAPNNGDSMEYHLARVAHWIQYRSVGEYATGSIRQTALAAGAEYLLLVLQVISGSDRLGALVQLGCYVLVVLSAPALARMAGAPRSVAAVGALLAAAVPMGVLQASSTQNDLVASVMAIAVVATAVRCLRMRDEVRMPSALLLGSAVAGAVLVKLSAAVTVLPLLVLVAMAIAVREGRAPRAARIGALSAAALLAVALVALESRRPLALARVPSAITRFTYPALGDWGDRLVNSVRGALRHLPAPDELLSALGPMPFEYVSSSLVAGFGPLVPHEDFVGNPVHAALAVCALLAVIGRWRTVPARGRWAVTSLVCAWVIFHASFRDNEFLTRLQLPLFALWPAFLVAVPRGEWPARLTRWSAAIALGLALWVGVSNYARPPFASDTGPTELMYYRTFGGERPRALQLAALKLADETGCRRIAIFMGENGFDYPITWMAMRRGSEVRHLLTGDAWPCVIYSEPGSWPGWGLQRPEIELNQAEWTLVGAYRGTPYLFARKRFEPQPRASD